MYWLLLIYCIYCISFKCIFSCSQCMNHFLQLSDVFALYVYLHRPLFLLRYLYLYHKPSVFSSVIFRPLSAAINYFHTVCLPALCYPVAFSRPSSAEPSSVSEAYRPTRGSPLTFLYHQPNLSVKHLTCDLCWCTESREFGTRWGNFSMVIVADGHWCLISEKYWVTLRRNSG